MNQTKVLALAITVLKAQKSLLQNAWFCYCMGVYIFFTLLNICIFWYCASKRLTAALDVFLLLLKAALRKVNEEEKLELQRDHRGDWSHCVSGSRQALFVEIHKIKALKILLTFSRPIMMEICGCGRLRLDYNWQQATKISLAMN